MFVKEASCDIINQQFVKLIGEYNKKGWSVDIDVYNKNGKKISDNDNCKGEMWMGDIVLREIDIVTEEPCGFSVLRVQFFNL